ncbi:hypothetical protein [Labrys sp. ZIDIC5]|uniref:hypothetical protein n=1 Tax=Labrys sedimenti TaxID=3106036 RepID=UPI002ACA58DE|nr:hypothetical protein [Labrys sp. ZIDIC5]MDZ5452108.1 hypothetical protein [Labrys sp. ZIDIC5]
MARGRRKNLASIGNGRDRYGRKAPISTVLEKLTAGPIKTSGVWLDFAHADAGDIYFNGGSTITVTGPTHSVFSSGGGLISMRGRPR